MAEDLLDYWVGLIKTIFPENAWITSHFYNNDHSIKIDWKLKNDPRNPNKRSKKIEIIINESAIEDYLDKNKKDRELSDIMLKEFIYARYNQFISDNDIHTHQHASTEKWLISRDVINCSLHLTPPLGIKLDQFINNNGDNRKCGLLRISRVGMHGA